MDKPVIKQDPLYQLLRNEDIKGFNEQRDKLDTSELKNGDRILIKPGEKIPADGRIVEGGDDLLVGPFACLWSTLSRTRPRFRAWPR